VNALIYTMRCLRVAGVEVLGILLAFPARFKHLD